MSTLNVSIVQADLHWHDGDANRRHLRTMVDSIVGDTDLVVLPEMFATGFSMAAAELAETDDGESVRWMRQVSKDLDAVVCGSLIIVDEGRFYNRLFAVKGAETLAVYDKRHLFRLADEQKTYSAGTEIVTFDIGDFRVCPMICYDLRFPVWSRNRNHYDLLLYVANWPSRRHFAWQTLLRARAIENLSYVAGVNRVGRDGNDLPYDGGSAVVDYLGGTLADLGDAEGVTTVSVDRTELERFRERFAFHLDADRFTLDP